MKTVILAGGFGTRLSEETVLRPKPMVEVGQRPMLWHIMNIYAAAGFDEFIVALGYKGEVIKDFFRSFYELTNDLTVRLSRGSVDVVAERQPDWTVHLVETGLHTKTGGRILRLRDRLEGQTFMVTYGDGVSDIDVASLVDFHRAHGKLATVTAVRPPARFGGLHVEGTAVTRFNEKPQAESGWINGGFFVLEPGVFDYLDDDDTVWERDPLEEMAADGELQAFFHDGFFQPMDTLREKRILEDLWSRGEAPWKVW